MREAVLTPDQPDNLRSLGERISAVPGLSQLLLLVGLAAAIAAGLSLFMWSRAPGFQPLYSGLPEQDVALASRIASIPTLARSPCRRRSCVRRG